MINSPSDLSPRNKALLYQTFSSGGVIAYPTEAVYGLGCDPWDESAVRKILKIKRRSVDKGLILIASDIGQLSPIFDHLTAKEKNTLIRDWPGPVTWVVPHFGFVPDYVSGGRDTVAVRVTAHPLAAGIARYIGKPIVSTSANPSAFPPALTPLKCRLYFGKQVAILPGALGKLDRPTTIKDLRSGDIHRR